MKLFFALAIFFISCAAGWIPFRRRLKKQEHFDFPIGETLATGVFLGAALLHMLPEANTIFKSMGYEYPLAFIITGSVFLIFLWFEHIGEVLYSQHQLGHPAFAILAWLMLSIHSFMIGAALGLAQYQSMVIMLFLAIIVHKWAESFAIAVQLNKSHLKLKNEIVLFFVYSLMTPLGMLLGWFSEHKLHTNALFTPVLIAASAGTFLYLGTLHGLKHCVMLERCCNLKDFSFVIIGFLIMALVAFYV